MQIQFTKMHGAGNDFIVIDGIHQDLSQITQDQWKFLAHRQFGIGADQILIIEKPHSPDADFRYRIINHDGSEVEQCGNGSRCFVRFVREKGLTQKTKIRVEVAHTTLTLTEKDDGMVEVNMGAPIFDVATIPFVDAGLPKSSDHLATLYDLAIHDEETWIQPISMGNPHAVQIVPSAQLAKVLEDGPHIEKHPVFPNRVNAGFMEILNAHEITLRVFERGSGETLACGTGACAAVVSGILRGKLHSPVLVHTRGGDLSIAWNGLEDLHSPVMMTGPAVTVFSGTINLPN